MRPAPRRPAALGAPGGWTRAPLAGDAGGMTAGESSLPFDRADVDAVSLDVGGVMVVPHHGMLGPALTVAGVPPDRVRFDTTALLQPIHEEPQARCYRLTLP